MIGNFFSQYHHLLPTRKAEVPVPILATDILYGRAFTLPLGKPNTA